MTVNSSRQRARLTPRRLLVIPAGLVTLFACLDGAARPVAAGNEAEYATQCPRWARLSEELLSYEGGTPQSCELVKSDATTYVYRAAPNIEVDVMVTGPDKVIENVRIRDVRSKASVTYNAEALALLK